MALIEHLTCDFSRDKLRHLMNLGSTCKKFNKFISALNCVQHAAKWRPICAQIGGINIAYMTEGNLYVKIIEHSGNICMYCSLLIKHRVIGGNSCNILIICNPNYKIIINEYMFKTTIRRYIRRNHTYHFIDYYSLPKWAKKYKQFIANRGILSTYSLISDILCG
jgi:hypothetical protein